LYRSGTDRYQKWKAKYVPDTISSRLSQVRNIALDRGLAGLYIFSDVQDLIRPILDKYAVTGPERAKYIAFANKLLKELGRLKAKAYEISAKGILEYFIKSYGIDPTIAQEILSVLLVPPTPAPVIVLPSGSFDPYGDPGMTNDFGTDGDFATGTVYTDITLGGTLVTHVTAVDYDADRRDEIFALDAETGTLYVIDAYSKQFEKKLKILNRLVYPMLIIKDGIIKLIASDKIQYIDIVNLAGKQLFKISIPQQGQSMEILHLFARDLDNDYKFEIVTIVRVYTSATEYYILLVIAKEGIGIIKTITLPSAIYATRPCFCDVDGDGIREIVVNYLMSSESKLMVVKLDGTIINETSLPTTNCVFTVCKDIDDDNIDEIFAVSLDGLFMFIDPTTLQIVKSNTPLSGYCTLSPFYAFAVLMSKATPYYVAVVNPEDLVLAFIDSVSLVLKTNPITLLTNIVVDSGTVVTLSPLFRTIAIDADRDGLKEIVAFYQRVESSRLRPFVSLVKYPDKILWTKQAIEAYEATVTPEAIYVADVDGDKLKELIVGSLPTTNTVRIFKG